MALISVFGNELMLAGHDRSRMIPVDHLMGFVCYVDTWKYILIRRALGTGLPHIVQKKLPSTLSLFLFRVRNVNHSVPISTYILQQQKHTTLQHT